MKFGVLIILSLSFLIIFSGLVFGAAPVNCQSGTTYCNGFCVATDFNRNNCGSCGNVCGAGQFCSEGVCVSNCGNGVRESPQEQCDLGANNGHPCTAAYGSSCTYCSFTCQNVVVTGPYCGDYGVQAGNGEQCDISNLNGQTCASLGYYPGNNLQCSNCRFDVSKCGAGCGNLVPEPARGETCDYGNSNGQACNPSYGGTGCTYCSSTTCQIVTVPSPKCGDYIVQSGYEECDGSPQWYCSSYTSTHPPLRSSGSLKCTGCRIDSSGCKYADAYECQAAFGYNYDFCSGLCTNTKSDSSNCGGCGRKCTNSAPYCVQGTCTCPSGMAVCNGYCIYTTDDVNNCGGCGRVCSGNAPYCRSGDCVQCFKGFQCASNNCVNGGCTTSCAGQGGFCSNAIIPSHAYLEEATITYECGLTSKCWFCNTGYGNCDRNTGNGCEANKNTDNNNCGTCGNTCTGGKTCKSGVCKAECTASGGICAPISSLSNAYSDLTNYYCTNGYNCLICNSGYFATSSGSCVANSCSDTDGGNTIYTQGTVSGYLNGASYSYTDSCYYSGTTTVYEYYCSGTTNTATITNCPASNICLNGVCNNPSCTYYNGWCNSGIANTAINNAYKCAGGTNCYMCTGTYTRCSNTCVNLTSDTNNCGQCNVKCNDANTAIGGPDYTGKPNCVGGTCKAADNCPTGCRASALTHSTPNNAYNCNSGSCYICNNGYTWSGALCTPVQSVCGPTPYINPYSDSCYQNYFSQGCINYLLGTYGTACCKACLQGYDYDCTQAITLY